jgi:hypothetical protein
VQETAGREWIVSEKEIVNGMEEAASPSLPKVANETAQFFSMAIPLG